MKVLVLRFSSIGDIVLTTPVVRVLRQQLGAEVHYATKKAYRGLVEPNPHIAKVHVLDGSLGELVQALRQERFDHVVDLHHNLRTLLIKLRLGVPASSFPKLNWEKWLYVRFKINRMPAKHIVDRYLEAAAPLGVKPDDGGLDYFIPERDEVPLEWLPETHQQGYVAVAIGAQHATKRLPLPRLIELCDRINKPIILLGGKEDAATGEAVEAFFHRLEAHAAWEEGLRNLNKKAQVFNGCGKFNLHQSASLVRQARAVFTHDTGLMHIAAAFRKEVFSIWGNTTPHFGMYPYRTKFTVLEHQKLPCRPCSKIGHAQCPLGHFKCMNELPLDFYLP